MSSTPAPITFNGSSTYSSAFQQVITRAVNIASLPMESLQNDITNLSSQQSELTTIGTDFTALQTAVQNPWAQQQAAPQPHRCRIHRPSPPPQARALFPELTRFRWTILVLPPQR